MKSLFRTLALTGIVCGVSGSAMAVVSAPGPEIGDGAVGVFVAAVALLAVILYPRLRRSR